VIMVKLVKVPRIDLGRYVEIGRNWGPEPEECF